MATTLKPLYPAGTQTITITLASLALSSTLVAGRESDVVSFGPEHDKQPGAERDKAPLKDES